MPEPDLVKIGNYTVVDNASIVCHLNTKGSFALRTITIGEHCTLRTQSRVQQSVEMQKGSMLLEKSIAMTGDIVERRTVWQGCPAQFWFAYRKSNDDDDDDDDKEKDPNDTTVHNTSVDSGSAEAEEGTEHTVSTHERRNARRPRAV